MKGKKSTKKVVKSKKFSFKSVSKQIAKAVDKKIERKIETKQTNSQFSDNNVGGTADSAIGTQLIPVSPYAGFVQIPQGTGDGQRVGNVIKTKYCNIKYTLFPNPYDAVSNNLVKPIIFQFFLFRDKKATTAIPLVSDVLATLYNASNTVTAATGTVKDLTFAINKDRWQVFKRWTHKLGYAVDNIQGTVAANQYFSNNDFKMFYNKTVDCTKYLHKTIIYDDGTYYPSTPGVFLFYYTIYADGSTVPNGQYGAQFNLSIDYQFKDS